MPCWEVRTMSVEFHAKHQRLLEQAIDALGWYREAATQGNILVVRPKGSWDPLTIDLDTSRATIADYQQGHLNELKQQYSKEALKRAAKLAGWNLRAKTATQGVLRR
jgi:hypothetical protein